MHRSPSVRICALACVALAATALSPVAASAAKPRKGRGYQGQSAQKSGSLALPVGIRVSKSGKQVDRFDIQWTSRCSSPTGRGSYSGLAVSLKKKVTSSGRFSDTGKAFTQKFSNGTTGTFAVTLLGRFSSASKATGTFRMNVTIKDAAGTQIDTCDSGSVKWTARD